MWEAREKSIHPSIRLRFLFAAVSCYHRVCTIAGNPILREKQRQFMAGVKGRSGPPSNMNAFKHGLVAIQKRRRRALPRSTRKEFSCAKEASWMKLVLLGVILIHRAEEPSAVLG